MSYWSGFDHGSKGWNKPPKDSWEQAAYIRGQQDAQRVQQPKEVKSYYTPLAIPSFSNTNSSSNSSTTSYYPSSNSSDVDYRDPLLEFLGSISWKVYLAIICIVCLSFGVWYAVDGRIDRWPPEQRKIDIARHEAGMAALAKQEKEFEQEYKRKHRKKR